MKKIFAGLTLALLVLAPSLGHAQELTQADVEAIAPQLSQTLTALGGLISSIKSQLASQNATLSQDLTILGNISLRLGTPPMPTSQETETMATELSSVQANVSTVVNWRDGMQKAMGSIGQILGSIGNMITSAA